MKLNSNKKGIKNNILLNNMLPYIIIFAMTVFLLLISCSTGIFVGLTKDVPVYLNVARNLLNGKVLYSEIVDNKGPVLYFMNALFLKLGGRFGMVLLEFILLYTIFLFAYKTIKLLNDNKKHQIIVLVLMGTYLLRFFTYGLACEEYALAFSMIGLYECVKYYKNDKFSIYQCYSLGILGGLCFFIRQNLIVVFAGFGIGIFIKHIIEKRYKELIKYIIFSILGFITVALPILGYLLINNCFNDYIYYTFTLNMHIEKLGFFKSLIVIFDFIPITTYLIILYLYMMIRSIFKEKNIKNLGFIFTITSTILFNVISKTVAYHYLIIFIPTILLSLVQFIQIKQIESIHKSLLLIINITLIGICIFNVVSSAVMFKRPEENQNIANFIKNNTSKEDKIAIIGFADEIYYLSDRDSASRYTYLLSNGAFNKQDQINIVNDYLNDIMNVKPKIIVILDEYMKYAVRQYVNSISFDIFILNNYELRYREDRSYKVTTYDEIKSNYKVENEKGEIKVYVLNEQ